MPIYQSYKEMVPPTRFRQEYTKARLCSSTLGVDSDARILRVFRTPSWSLCQCKLCQVCSRIDLRRFAKEQAPTNKTSNIFALIATVTVIALDKIGHARIAHRARGTIISKEGTSSL